MNPTDAGADTDGDEARNVEEFARGTDPHSFDGSAESTEQIILNNNVDAAVVTENEVNVDTTLAAGSSSDSEEEKAKNGILASPENLKDFSADMALCGGWLCLIPCPITEFAGGAMLVGAAAVGVAGLMWDIFDGVDS